MIECGIGHCVNEATHFCRGGFGHVYAECSKCWNTFKEDHPEEVYKYLEITKEEYLETKLKEAL